MPCQAGAYILSRLVADRPPGSRAFLSVYVLFVISGFVLEPRELFYIGNHYMNSKQTNVCLYVRAYLYMYTCVVPEST